MFVMREQMLEFDVQDFICGGLRDYSRGLRLQILLYSL